MKYLRLASLSLSLLSISVLSPAQSVYQYTESTIDLLILNAGCIPIPKLEPQMDIGH